MRHTVALCLRHKLVDLGKVRQRRCFRNKELESIVALHQNLLGTQINVPSGTAA